jgi:aspartate/methionine/tyrosine aminotransferase
MARIAGRLDAIAPSQIREMMRLAQEVGAINMAQGRPDFAADAAVKRAAIEAIEADHNQYTITWGLPALRQAVGHMLARRFGIEADPESEITITCGVTEAMVAAMLALVDPGDEVVIIEPAHENYLPAVAFAGGTPRYVGLEFPEFELDVASLERVMSSRTRVVVVNSPSNPMGRVFTSTELASLVEVAERHDAVVLTDEIYDYLTYDGAEHVCLAALPGARERTVLAGGISKIHAVTGWRLGFVVAPRPISAAIRTVHDYLTICAPTPFQHAGVRALGMPDSYFDALREKYRVRRDRMMEVLASSGFVGRPPKGAYYVMASYEAWEWRDSAEAFVEHLITECGVAVVPGPSFYPGHPELGAGLVRFSFAKELDTLDEVERRLSRGLARRREMTAPS